MFSRALEGLLVLGVGLNSASAITAKEKQADRNFLRAAHAKVPGLKKFEEVGRKHLWKNLISHAIPLAEEHKRKLADGNNWNSYNWNKNSGSSGSSSSGSGNANTNSYSSGNANSNNAYQSNNYQANSYNSNANSNANSYNSNNYNRNANNAYKSNTNSGNYNYAYNGNGNQQDESSNGNDSWNYNNAYATYNSNSNGNSNANNYNYNNNANANANAYNYNNNANANNANAYNYNDANADVDANDSYNYNNNYNGQVRYDEYGNVVERYDEYGNIIYDDDEEEEEEEHNYNNYLYQYKTEEYAENYDPNGFTEIQWNNLGFDIASYSLKYTGCAAVQTWSDYYAQYESTVLATHRFALFRLCPSTKCNPYSVSGCSANYGEYVLDMDLFLEGVVNYNRQRYWHYCHYCRRCKALESYGEKMAEIEEKKQEYMQQQSEYYYELQQQQQEYEQKQSNYFDDEEAQFGEEYYDYNGNGRRLGNDYNANEVYYYQQQSQTYMYGNNGDQDSEMYWDEELFGEWDDEWDEQWLMYNWQYLPYCSYDDVEGCEYSEDYCEEYSDDDYDEQDDDNARYALCTQIDDGYYVAPHCSDDGFTITLAVYNDDGCNNYVKDVSIQEVLGYDAEGDFELFPTSECISCEEGEDEKVYDQFVRANYDYDNYEEYMQETFQEYIEAQNQQREYYNQYQEWWQNQQQWQQNFYNYNYDGNGNNGNGNENGDGQYQFKYWYQYNKNGGGYNPYGTSSYQGSNNNNMNYNYFGQQQGAGDSTYYNRDALYNSGSNGSNEGFYYYTHMTEEEMEEQQQYQYEQGNGYRMRGQWMQYGIADVCGVLYEYSAKCNKQLSNWMGQGFSEMYLSQEQQQNEELVCNFIDNLQANAYNEYGEIVLDSNRNTANSFSNINWRDTQKMNQVRKAMGITGGQIAALLIMAFACIGMAVWACLLHGNLARKNIPWRPKFNRNKKSVAQPTNIADITRNNSGIVMGRSRSGPLGGAPSGKTTPLI